MSESTDPMDAARRARAVMAEKIRMPRWYVPIQAVALFAIVGAGAIDRLLLLHGGATGWIGLAGLLVLLGGEWALWRSRGVSFSRTTMRAYPSTRAPGLLFLAVAVIGAVAVTLLARHHLPASAVVAVVATLASTAALVRVDAARAGDVREGRVAG